MLGPFQNSWPDSHAPQVGVFGSDRPRDSQASAARWTDTKPAEIRVSYISMWVWLKPREPVDTLMVSIGALEHHFVWSQVQQLVGQNL